MLEKSANSKTALECARPAVCSTSSSSPDEYVGVSMMQLERTSVERCVCRASKLVHKISTTHEYRIPKLKLRTVRTSNFKLCNSIYETAVGVCVGVCGGVGIGRVWWW